MRSFALSLAVGVALAVAPTLAHADNGPSAENQKAAGQHFTKARELYQTGSYREAVSELEVALALDPTAKDLVYNLGVLSEKLNRIDDSIKYFRRYIDMDVDASERTKAEGFIKRLEGAKKEVVVAKSDDGDEDHPRGRARPDAPPPPLAKSSGTLNAILITGVGLGVVGIAVGSIVGAKAVSDKPASGTVTSAALPYSALANQASNAHGEAIIADVALGVGIVAAVTTLVLYLGTRPRTPIYLSHVPAVSPLVGANTGGAALTGSF